MTKITIMENEVDYLLSIINKIFKCQIFTSAFVLEPAACKGAPTICYVRTSALLCSDKICADNHPRMMLRISNLTSAAFFIGGRNESTTRKTPRRD